VRYVGLLVLAGVSGASLWLARTLVGTAYLAAVEALVSPPIRAFLVVGTVVGALSAYGAGLAARCKRTFALWHGLFCAVLLACVYALFPGRFWNQIQGEGVVVTVCLWVVAIAASAVATSWLYPWLERIEKLD
jgi:hypothetical protein